MATKKITELAAANNLSSNSLLVVVVNPDTTPSTRKITVGSLFSNVATNVNISANTTTNNLIVANTLSIPYRATPANSTAITISNNAIFHDGSYLYIATGTNIVKRTLLALF